MDGHISPQNLLVLLAFVLPVFIMPHIISARLSGFAQNYDHLAFILTMCATA